MAAWKQRRKIRHGCEGRAGRERRKQFKWRYIDMMGINHMKFSWREIENFIGPSLFLRNKGNERVCMFLGASLLSSGSFTMKPPPDNGAGVGYPMSPRVFRLFGHGWKSQNKEILSYGIRNLGLWNPKSKFIQIRNVEPADWNPESKTFLDYLTWVDRGHLFFVKKKNRLIAGYLITGSQIKVYLLPTTKAKVFICTVTCK